MFRSDNDLISNTEDELDKRLLVYGSVVKLY